MLVRHGGPHSRSLMPTRYKKEAEMNIPGLSERTAQRLLAGVGAIAITAALSGAALAADTTPAITAASTVIKGCFNATSGALRVLTSHGKTCGSEHAISWNQAGNGYAFTTTKGTLNKYSLAESDGTVLTKAGTYFVNVAAKLNIATYTTGGAGFCALDLVHGTTGTKFVFEIFSPWSYPAPALNIENTYPYGSGGMIRVTAKQAGFQLGLFCLDNSFTIVPVKSATWIVSPVSASSSSKAAIGHSTVGPAGFRPKPALKPGPH
jgi:hypothetical protein